MPTTTPSAQPVKALVVLVPGMSVAEPGLYLGRLTEGLKSFAATRDLELEEASGVKPTDPRRFGARTPRSAANVEFVEAYWSDLRPRLSAESGLKKLWGGLSLLAFWLGSPKVWARSFGSKYMLLNATGTVLLILAWYYGAIATLLSACGSDPELFRAFGLEAAAPVLAAWGKAMGGWPVWLAIGAVTAFLPMLVVVDVTHASMAYLVNRDHFATKVKARVEKVLYAAINDDYERIVVVAHSFGVGVAVEVLSELETKPEATLSLVTLGGSLGLVRARSPRLDAAYGRLLGAGLLASWTDFWSDQDWLGTPSLEAAGALPPGFVGQPMEASLSLPSKLSGESHGLYFQEAALYETLVDRCG